MSRAYFTWQEAILRSKLEPTTKLVCHTIGCHMAADGSGCFPSYATIADESGLHRATVIRHVDKAAQGGFLEVIGRVDEEGDQTSNLYRPVMPRGVVAQDDHLVAHGDHGSRTARLGVVAQRDPNYPTEPLNEHTTRARRFNEFWETYPRKVARTQCEAIWKRRRLDNDADLIIASTKRFKACEQWLRGIIPNPSTFLNQERWKDPVPAGETKRGEIRVRETTPQEAAEAESRAEFIRLSKLPENLQKTEAEIWQVMKQLRQDSLG